MAVPGNPILDASNAFLSVTNKEGAPSGGIETLDGLPVGTVGASATGELAVKVVSVGGTASTPPTGASSTQVQGTAADNAVAVGNPVYAGGKAVTGQTYAPAYTAGDVAAIAVDAATGALLTQPVAPSLGNSTAYAASLVIKAAAGRLYGLSGHNSLASAQFIQVHNSASLPADTAVPIAIKSVAASSSFEFNFGPLGIALSTGIVVCNSSTGPTKTIGAADCYFTASYI